jgi:hypothetical protein
MHSAIPRNYIRDSDVLVVHEQFSDVNFPLVSRNGEAVFDFSDMDM